MITTYLVFAKIARRNNERQSRAFEMDVGRMLPHEL